MAESKDLSRVLFVDDEQAVLDGLRRQLRKSYDVTTACGPSEGLEVLKSDGPFEVVVSDFKMPEMNGAQFLAEAHVLDPEMIPVMLTGQADQETAVDAINRGHIFRFLCKPCESSVLVECLDAAIEQRRLKRAEKDLLEQTVRGSVEVLADVLSLANPVAFGRARRIRDLVRHVVEERELEDPWVYETAALLSQIGCVAVPDELLTRSLTGGEITAAEREVLDGHSELASNLLTKIPRLQDVAGIVRRQQGAIVGEPCEPAVEGGGRILDAALTYERLLLGGASRKEALTAMAEKRQRFGAPNLIALASAVSTGGDGAEKVLTVRELRVGMVVLEELCNTEGSPVVTEGHEITVGSLERLRNYAHLGVLARDRITVRIPSAGGRSAA